VPLFTYLTLNGGGDRDRTAREIAEIHTEKLLMLGPVLENLHHDLDRIIDLTFTFMARAGILPPAPQELQGLPLKVEYISVLAQAQHATGMGALERFVGFIGGVAGATGDPTVWDKFDADQAVDEAHRMLGAAPRVIRSDESVGGMREQRQQQQAQSQAMQMAEQSAAISKDISEVSKNNQGGANPLDVLTGGAV
jgi:hypothetical protein